MAKTKVITISNQKGGVGYEKKHIMERKKENIG